MTGGALKWIERLLLLAGTGLALWSAAILLEAHFFKHLPPPPPQVNVTVDSYHDLPSTGGWVARLDAPAVNLTATVLEGSDDSTLARAAGHIEDTAFPGDPGNVGIAGHRDTTFRAVRNLKVGDLLRLTTAQGRFDYRISSTKIVDPTDVYVLDNADHQTLTLVTCYPFEYIGHAPHRYIIRADRVGEKADAATSRTADAAAPAAPAFPSRTADAAAPPLPSR